jgi:hypothetical protein
MIVIPSGVEESLAISEILRDVSASPRHDRNKKLHGRGRAVAKAMAWFVCSTIAAN